MRRGSLKKAHSPPHPPDYPPPLPPNHPPPARRYGLYLVLFSCMSFEYAFDLGTLDVFCLVMLGVFGSLFRAGRTCHLCVCFCCFCCC